MARRSFPCRWLAVLLAAIGVLTFSTALWAETPRRGGTLTFMTPSISPPSFDGHKEITFALVHIVRPHYSTLIRADPRNPAGGKIVCDLCESWRVSRDLKTYTFNVRRGVRFHDGSPLTARDVAVSLRRVMFPPEGVISMRKAFFPMVASVKNTDDYTVVIKLKFATAAFIPALAVPFNWVYSADKLAKDKLWPEKNILGSGPFKFVSTSAGSHWNGARYEKYHHKGLPYLDGYQAISARKQNVRIQAIRGGRAMAEFRGFPPAARDDLVRAMGKGITIQESIWNCQLMVTPNSYRKPFDDVRVRRALNLALDRWGGSKHLSRIAIMKEVGGIVIPSHPLAPSKKELEQLEGFGRDVAANRRKARRLLKEAGVPKGFKFVFNNRAIDQPFKILGVWLIDQWRQIGLHAEQSVVPTGLWFSTLRSGKGPDNPPNFDVSIDFTCGTIVNPTLDVSKVISYNRNPANYGNYNDPELDRLFDLQLHETDPARQKKLLFQLQKRLVDQAWTINTLWWNRIIAHSTKMRGWHITPSHFLGQDLSMVWLAE